MKGIFFINFLWAMLASICMTACMEPFEAQQGEEMADYGEMKVSFGVKARSTTTVISPEEAQNFLITVSQGGEVVRGPQTLGTMNMRFPAGQGYSVYAESCMPADAESSNNGWGQKRFVGSSEEFGINKGETTTVKVGMSVDNAAMCVVINPSLANYFKQSCTVTLSNADRGLQWNYNNAGKVEEGVTTDGQIAYFNVDESNERVVNYTIEAVSDNNTIRKEGTITLSRAKMSRLNLAYDSGFFTLTINVDEADLYDDKDLTTGPQDVISDDGSTEATGGNDDFNNDGTEVDYDQYK